MAQTRFLGSLVGTQKPGFLTYLSVESQKLLQKPGFSTNLCWETKVIAETRFLGVWVTPLAKY
ncbi:hypothetical protein [Planktothrix pseudagardhii]|uniref:hypothetical protein n=1 Tax=Planktothrix pseudagardhii TaxID=132604 RepID=UPI0020B20A69|nr:hypothetical protein [Planktothrix pseudagardhii]